MNYHCLSHFITWYKETIHPNIILPTIKWLKCRFKQKKDPRLF